MRLGNYLRVLAWLTLFGCSTHVAAADFYWINEAQGKAAPYSSAQSACEGYAAYLANANSATHRIKSLTYNTETRFTCSVERLNADGNVVSTQTVFVTREGTACPVGTTNDPAAGQCVSDNPCLAKAGIEESFSRTGTAPDAFAFVGPSGHFGTQRQGCKGGCATELTDIRLKGKVSGWYYARGTATYSGQQCSTTGTGDQIVDDTNESTEPEVIKEDVPCVYSASGDTKVCQSKKSEEIEGKYCGTVNGVETCVSSAPTKNGIDITTEVTTETAADGSSTTTKKDTATVTKCEGVKNCTSTTATTTTTTKKDANGNTTGTDSACIGDACASSGNPDSDGDGVGDCIGDDCGAGGGVEGQDWYTSTGDTFGSVLTEFVGKVQQTPVASQTSSFLTFRATGSCPRWSVSVWVFDIDIDQLCNGDIPWNAIKAVILAAAGFFAFRIALL